MPSADLSIYRAAFNSSPDGLAICTPDGTLLCHNPAMHDILSTLFPDPDKTLEDFLARSLRGKFPFQPFPQESNSFCVPIDLPDGRHSRCTFTLLQEKEELVLVCIQIPPEKNESSLQKNANSSSHTAKIIKNMGISISDSPQNAHMREMAERAAKTSATILIAGESGVGKEVVARFIHNLSPRALSPFCVINCGAIPETLFESELFGYEQGAFTDARKTKPGIFELANKGSLFLDEIGELPLALQVKLLRAIQTKEIFRVGGTRAIPLDVRIIAATNRNLEAMIREGRFREDLFYRLNVIRLEVPPVRERGEGLRRLILHFLKEHNTRYGCQKKLSSEAFNMLMTYSWPGNVREVENIMERLVILTPEDIIPPSCLPEGIRNPTAPYTENSDNTNVVVPLKVALDKAERELLLKAAHLYPSSRKMAKALGVDNSTIVRKMRKYGLRLSSKTS